MEKENEKKTKKTKTSKIILKVLLVFFIVVTVMSIISMITITGFRFYKYGEQGISEMVMAFLVIVFVLITNKGYIFTEKKESFKKTFIQDIPMVIITICMLIASIVSLNKVPNVNVVINLFIFCIFIGIFEEVLFRGWLQNQFIEKFGNTRKKVLLSIFLSAIIFGSFHSTNVIVGQGVLMTIMQVIQTIGMGVYWGSIYYKSKNIWNVICLHGIYDFSIMLANANYLKDPSTGNASQYILTVNIFSSVLLMLIYIISSFLILRKSKIKNLLQEDVEMLDEEIERENKTSKELIACLVLVFVVFFAIGFIPQNKLSGYEEYNIIYEYKEKNINKFTTSYFHKEEFEMNYTDAYKFKVYYSEDLSQLIVENINTKDKINLVAEKSSNNIISNVSLYGEVIENDDNFIIAYFDDISNQNGADSKVYYIKIPKNSISNDKEFLENLKKSIKIFDLPKIDQIGYLTTEDSKYKYTLIYSTVYDKFIIDENDDIYVLTNNVTN